MTRIILKENDLPKYFWVEVIDIACYVLNYGLLKLVLKKTLYELFKKIKKNLTLVTLKSLVANSLF